MSTQAQRQGLLEQIALCEGIVDRLKAEDPPPVALLQAVRSVLARKEETLGGLDAAEAAAGATPLDP